MSAGIFLVILGAMQGREWGWTSGATLLTLAIGALLLVAFVGVEARVAAPLVNPSLLRNSDLLSSNAVGFLMAFGMFGSLFFLPLYMQNVLHYSPAISGLATLPSPSCSPSPPRQPAGSPTPSARGCPSEWE